MDYDRIIIELLNRIGILEEKVATLENKIESAVINEAEPKPSSKNTDISQSIYMTAALIQSNLNSKKLNLFWDLTYLNPQRNTVHFGRTRTPIRLLLVG